MLMKSSTYAYGLNAMVELKRYLVPRINDLTIWSPRVKQILTFCAYLRILRFVGIFLQNGKEKPYENTYHAK